jgi:hypothetical protein
VQKLIPFFQLSSLEQQKHEMVSSPAQDHSLGIISTLSASTPKEIAFARRPSVLVDLRISAPTILVSQFSFSSPT